MKKFSENFRSSLRDIRQLNAIVSYHGPNGFYILSTEDDDNLLTENDFEIATESGVIDYDKETINSVNPLFNANLFKTTCKSVQIDCKNEISKNTNVEVRIGVYKENENKYEYLNYGNYIIQDITYQADSDSYLMTGYDKMIESMVSYDDNPLSITFPIKHKDFVIAICNKLGWGYDLINYPNYNKNIVQDFYKGQNLTYRDILDDLNGVCGGSFMFNLRNKLIWKRPTETNEIVEDDDLKDVNVDFLEKYGKVNVLTITTNGNVVLDSKEDSQSIQENGKTEFNINDNYILSYSTSDFIDEMFDEVNGLEYYLYDVDSTGLLIFEPLDTFTFRHNGVDYKTIMFNDDIKLTQGLVETTYVERPEETEKDYVTTDKDKNKLNNALISIDKANAEIVLKVDSNGKISQVRLDGNADSGSVIEINADQVNLTANDILNLIAGNTINLTAKNIEIDSTNFKVDKDGNMICNNANAKELNIEGGNISLTGISGDDKRVNVNYDYDGSHWETIMAGHHFRVELDNEIRAIYGAGSIYLNKGNNTLILDESSVAFQKDGSTGLIVINGTNGNIECVSLTQTSLKENKKNFKKFENALEIINDIDIYQYNLKFEDDNTKKHLGFVIGDDFKYSELVTSNDNKGVDNYSFTSLCLQAIKEQQDQIETLQNQINELKEMIKNG